jgi:TetR/AcrR family transcriptional regulator, transcriptional repressor of aconitase
MAVIRLDSEERRKAIIDAALPLFARKGFAATTTKELAEAAGVSEALIFKHFPSKAALYAEILQAGCVGDPVLERLKALAPSTETLFHIVRGLVWHFLIELPVDPAGRAKQRLMVASYLEDGEFARLMHEWVGEVVVPIYRASIEAAADAGDLVGAPISPENGFWFAKHLASMIAVVRLPGRSTVPHESDAETLARQASWFMLRGLGLKEEVIQRLEASAGARLEAAPFGKQASYATGD